MAINDKAKDLFSVLIQALNATEKKHSSRNNDPDVSVDYTPEDFHDDDLLEISAMSDEDVKLELDELGFDHQEISRNIDVITNNNVYSFSSSDKKSSSIVDSQRDLMSEIIREALWKSLTYSSTDPDPSTDPSSSAGSIPSKLPNEEKSNVRFFPLKADKIKQDKAPPSSENSGFNEYLSLAASIVSTLFGATFILSGLTESSTLLALAISSISVFV